MSLGDRNKKKCVYRSIAWKLMARRLFFFNALKRELNLMVKYVTFNHSNMSSNLIALKYLTIK